MSGLNTDGMRTNMPMPLYMPEREQYGVSGLAGLASLIPYIGPILGAGLNMYGQYKQNEQQEYFYNQYMSPQARMRQMAQAGINPNAAAQGISGASAPQMNAAAPTGAFGSLGEQLGSSVNTMLSADMIRSQIENTNAITEGQKIQNDFEGQTFEDRALFAKNQGLISGEEYKQAAELTKNYPEILNQTIEETKSRIRKNDAEKREIDQKIINLQKEIDVMQEQIKEIKSGTTLNYALAGEAQAKEDLARAEKTLTDKKAELSDWEKRKYELGADDAVSLKYRDIEKKQGREAADKWLEGQYNIVNKVEQGVQDANVMTAEQRRIIESYDKQIAEAEKWLDECTRKYNNAGDFKKSWYRGSMESAQNRVDYLHKQKAEQLRRLGVNETKSVKAGPVGGSFSK